ncbi:MAG TPA: hypothetical protein VFV95_11580 [Vicinamibacterales bacterium]|nr:hypothetical protein [Vicinamibacterales bacterium]
MRISSHRSPWVAGLLTVVMAVPPGVVLHSQAKPATPATPAPATQAKPATPAAPAPATQAKPAATQAKPAAQANPPAGTNADTGWPRQATLNSGTVVWYQPQVESWASQKNIVAWSAVSYQMNGVKEPALGTIKIEGTTQISLDDRVVSMDDFRITEYNFKTLKPEQVKVLVSDVQALPQRQRVLDLDRLLAYVSSSPLQVKNVEGIKADPPIVHNAVAPAMLINLDGEPIWSPIKDVDLRYALNTNWDLFEYAPTKTLYVRYNQSWLQATSIKGPWTAVTAKLPESFSKLPADDNWKDVKAALPGKKLSTKTTPKVFVATEPAELIMTDGPPAYEAVPGASTLLWLKNTEADVFRMGKTGDFYFLVAGRWFRAPILDGPWTFATPDLPEDFKKIPVEHPRSRVLASIPGTPQATEAVLLAMVPRTARVNKKTMMAPEVAYSGEPVFKPIEGTKGLEQAVNTDKDIIKIGDLYYMCFQGVWFMARGANGPWEVASTVPKEVYTIPSSSSVHHVTYVTVEDDDDDEWVTFAYVAAYTGVMIGWGCAVWGSGWYYPPYVGYGGFYPRYYPYPHTYGMGAWYNPYTGAYGRGYAAYGPYGGVGMSASYNPRTGTYTRSAAAYGPYGSRSAGQAYNPRTGTYAQTRQGSNVYGNWGTSSVQRGDNWAQTAHRENYRTGTSTGGIRTDSGAAAIGRTGPGGNSGAIRTAGGDIYAGRDGNVYRRTDGGWEQSNGSGGWEPSQSPGAEPRDRQTTAGDRATTGTGQAGTRDRATTGTGTTAGAGASTRDRPTTGTSNVGSSGGQFGQLEGDRNARTSGNTRTSDRGSWQSGGSTRSGAGSYGGSRAGSMRGGGGRRR